MAWYLAPSLNVLRNEVNTRWPNRDKTSDGTIGDEAHQGTNSDHNPNSRESVDAWDMDKDGVNVNEVIAAFQSHPSAHYWIWNRQIADKDNGWQRKNYTGENPHTQHVHFSIRQSASAEQNTNPWGLLEEEMAFTPADAVTNWSCNAGSSANPVRALDRLNQVAQDAASTLSQVAELEAKIDQLLAQPAISVEAIVDGVLAGLTEGQALTKDDVRQAITEWYTNAVAANPL